MATSENIRDIVKTVLIEIFREEPEFIIEILVKNPVILQEALLKVAPWTSLIRSLEDLSMITKKDLGEVKSEIGRIRGEIGEIKNVMVTKRDLDEVKKDLGEVKSEIGRIRGEIGEIKNVMVTKRDLDEVKKLIEMRLMSIGSRWGLINEEAVREGIRDLLRSVGYSVEKWIWFDSTGYVYGHPSTIDLDIVIKDSLVIAIEITSSIKRGEPLYLKKKVELYEKVSGRKVSKIMMIAPYIADRNPDEIIIAAQKDGITIVAPEDIRTI
ncbi:MAG: DUF3782 domain-containing protein [Desulfurococcales archaeon]|nr:DUF3782 domain-containing protein [Desulfurococcales archaeon]